MKHRATTSSRCAVCGEPYWLQWHADGAYWAAVAKGFALSEVCFECFAVMAGGVDMTKIDYLAFWFGVEPDAQRIVLIDKPPYSCVDHRCEAVAAANATRA